MADKCKSNQRQSALHIKDHKMPYIRDFRHTMQHIFNPLHVYCRLVDCGMSRPKARNAIKAYEKYLYKPIMG